MTRALDGGLRIRAGWWSTAVERPRVVGLLLLAGLAVALVPVLVLPVFPTQDGAAHVDTAWVLLHRGDAGPVGEQLRAQYAVDLRPVPNMLSTGLLVALVWLLGADAGERALVGCLVAALVAAAWWALRGVDRRAGVLAVAALPYAGSHLVAFGFYNFAWGVVGSLLVLGLALRRADGWSLGAAVGLGAALTLTWTAHLLPFAVAALVALALAAARTHAEPAGDRFRAARAHLVPVGLALLPAGALTLRYLLSAQAPVGGAADWPTLLRPITLLIGLRPFAAGGYPDWPAALVVAMTLLALVVVRVRSGRTDPGHEVVGRVLGGLTLLLVVAYCLTPAELGSEFGFLDQRLAWFPPLLAVLWVASRLPSARVIGAAVVVLLTAGAAGVLLRLPQQADVVDETAQLLAVADVLPPAATFVVLQYADFGPYGGPDPLRHESSRIALRAGAVDVGHYEAAHPYFQVSFDGGPNVRRQLDPDLTGLEARPPDVDLPAARGELDYVVVLGWDQASEDVRTDPRSQAVQAELTAHYEQVPVPGSQRLLSLWRAVA